MADDSERAPRAELEPDRRAGAAGRAPLRAAAAVRGRRQRQDVGARRALRPGGPRGRHRARRRSSRSRSPTAPPASCASASASGCSRSASARRRATPRPPPSARSTASARGCCAPTRCRRASTPTSRFSTRGSPGGCASARSGGAAGSSSTGERTEAVDLVAAYGVDRAAGDDRRRPRPAAQPRPALAAPAARTRPSRARTTTRATRWRPASLLDELLGGFTERVRGAQARRARRSTSTTSSCAPARCSSDSRRACATAWSERFELLMVDEFQDTNPRQLGILSALERGQPVHGRRRVPVDLRLPPRRRGAVPRAARRARRARARASR